MMLAAENDKLSIRGLCMALQRIGLSHWSPETVLRSWGVAPVWVAGDRAAVPCTADEAIWIGFWLDADAESATLAATDEMLGLHAFKRCPESFQLAVLSNGTPQPIFRRPDQAVRELAVEVAVTARSGDTARERFRLCLIEPQEWTELSGRPAPPGLTGPPPLPPRLG